MNKTIVKKYRLRFLLAVFASVVSVNSSQALTSGLPGGPHRWKCQSRLYYSKRNKNNSDSFESEILEKRLQQLRIEILEEDMRRPPNTDLSPKQLIEEVMKGLRNPYHPVPDSGFRLMLRAATKQWRKKILDSIGAHLDSDLEIVASALGAAIGRPHNQFAILVGKGEEYTLEFADPTGYEDGTCWVECRLRDKETNSLLVITGWDLKKENGAWLVSRVDWQDFRDEFRPGIGREEWMREYP